MLTKKQIGTNFEKEAFKFLSEKFEEVIWLSLVDASSHYDFLCINKEKVFFVEAKYNSNHNKPCLRPEQRNCEYVIFKGKNKKIQLIHKNQFSKKVIQKKYSFEKLKQKIPFGKGFIFKFDNVKQYGILLNTNWTKKHNFKDGDYFDIESSLANGKVKK